MCVCVRACVCVYEGLYLKTFVVSTALCLSNFPCNHIYLSCERESISFHVASYISLGHVWICRTLMGCRLLIDRVRTLLMVSSCVQAFQEIVFCQVSVAVSWHLQTGNVRLRIVWKGLLAFDLINIDMHGLSSLNASCLFVCYWECSNPVFAATVRRFV